jgi:hypothetical protein
VKVEAIDDNDADVFIRATGYQPSADFKGIKMMDSEGLYVVIIGYDNWTMNAVQMHMWIPQPGKFTNRHFIREAFRYPFEIGNLGLVIGCIPADNEPSLEFTRRIGFTETYRIKDGWDVGVDLVLHEMRREECRWYQRRAA